MSVAFCLASFSFLEAVSVFLGLPFLRLVSLALSL